MCGTPDKRHLHDMVRSDANVFVAFRDRKVESLPRTFRGLKYLGSNRMKDLKDPRSNEDNSSSILRLHKWYSMQMMSLSFYRYYLF